MKEISREQGLLIEEIGMVIEERADLSPVAARIYATLILASDEGLTFEEITEVHQASKSSVSNNLKLLTKLKYVEYYTKPGERKRYFKAAKYYVKTAMETYNERFEKELEIVDKINRFNKKHNPEKFRNEKSVGTIYKEYLTQLNQGVKMKIQEVDTIEQ